MRTIPLSQGYVAIVDDADYERVSQYKWSLWKKKVGSRIELYATHKMRMVGGGRRLVQLHRFILDVWDERKVDHRDHNGLDCRRKNLRPCSTRQNCMNQRKRSDGTSKYKGVGWYPRYSMWVARIVFAKRRHCLGYFREEAQAALAYNEAAKNYFGEFAYLNDISEASGRSICD